jgi:cytochrome b
VTTVRVWDLPTRTFHWLFATVCTIAWFSGDDARYTHLHTFAGYTALSLLLFRIIWGIAGGRYARFSQFIRGPAAVLGHLRGLMQSSPQHHLGHNPAGGWAVMLLLSLVALLGLSGIVVLGGEEGFGPLAGVFSIEQGVAIHDLHEALAWALLGMVMLHLAGVGLESLVERVNLPRAMVSGSKPGEPVHAEPRNATWTGVILVLLVMVAAVLNIKPYLSQHEGNPYQPYSLPPLVQNSLWNESCSECHLAYHPSTLPQRSWERLFSEQENHFDEDLALDDADVTVLLEFARSNSAEQIQREMSWRTMHSLSADEIPLRITGTKFWKQTHSDIDDAVWRHDKVNGKLNCAACHRDAEQGGFMNGAMHMVAALPR